MAGITYTAKREIIKLAYSDGGTDISASSTDDSFNSTSTDLSGLADNDWIYVTGFTDASNNGWFQIAGTPTTTKIIIDSSTLVTEAAGDTVQIEGYDHGLDQSYSIDLPLKHYERKAEINKSMMRSISGASETLRHAKHYLWDCVTTGIALASLATYREFFGSVDGGEEFSIDPRGTVASPSNPVTVELISESYSETPIDGVDGYFSIGFTVREIAAVT